MRFLTLPPLVVILLLVFLWMILLTLLLWFAFRPRRAPDAERETRRNPAQSVSHEKDAAAPRPIRPQVVRELQARQSQVNQSQANPSQLGDDDQDNAFDSFRERNGRRDDFDF